MNDPAAARSGIAAEHLRVRYGDRQPAIIDGQSVSIVRGGITALIGPNGSGKSTLLKCLARQLDVEAGRVLLDGRDIATISGRDLARRLGILFQERTGPGDLTVEELVRHGRYPHRRMCEPLSDDDRNAVDAALGMADLIALRRSPLAQLSSGQRQLAWIAMTLAQGSDYILLDEPTTFLDLAHQFDVMDLVRRLNREHGRTIVLVLHDLHLAAAYADQVIALRNGRVAACGSPTEVMTAAILEDVFQVEARILRDEGTGRITCIPLGRSGRTGRR